MHIHHCTFRIMGYKSLIIHWILFCTGKRSSSPLLTTCFTCCEYVDDLYKHVVSSLDGRRSSTPVLTRCFTRFEHVDDLHKHAHIWSLVFVPVHHGQNSIWGDMLLSLLVTAGVDPHRSYCRPADQMSHVLWICWLIMQHNTCIYTIVHFALWATNLL